MVLLAAARKRADCGDEAVQRKLVQTRAAIDRYLHAFENGTMPDNIEPTYRIPAVRQPCG